MAAVSVLTCCSESTSKICETFPNISSSFPVSSPTANIRVIIGGNASGLCPSAHARGNPFSTSFDASRTAPATTSLPTTRDTTPSDSRMGTPAPTRSPSMRTNSVSMICRESGPIIGNRNESSSIFRFPKGVRRKSENPHKRPMRRRRTTYQKFTTILDTAISTRVMRGSWVLNSL